MFTYSGSDNSISKLFKIKNYSNVWNPDFWNLQSSEKIKNWLIESFAKLCSSGDRVQNLMQSNINLVKAWLIAALVDSWSVVRYDRVEKT